MALRTGLLSSRGFQQSIALATDPRSQQIHGCLGAYRLCSVSYSDFTCGEERRRPFSSLEGDSCALLLKDLQEAKASLAGRTLRGPVTWPSGRHVAGAAHAGARRRDHPESLHELPAALPAALRASGDLWPRPR